MNRTTFAVSLSLIMIAAPAVAQEDPRRAQAEALFQEGLRFHDRDREAEALERFERSYAIYPSPNTLLNMARSEQLLGRPLDALRHYRDALNNPLLNPKGHSLAQQFVTELESRLARVDLRGPKGLAVNVGGTEYILPARAIDVEPGPVVATGTLGADRYEGRLVASAGQLSVLELRPVTARSSTSPPLDTTSSPPASAESPYWNTRRVLGAGVFAVGAGAMVTSALFFSASSRSGDDAAGLRDENHDDCANGQTELCGKIRDAADAEHRDRNVARVLLASGALAALGGVVLWATAPSSSRAAGVQITPHLGGLDVRVGF